MLLQEATNPTATIASRLVFFPQSIPREEHRNPARGNAPCRRLRRAVSLALPPSRRSRRRATGVCCGGERSSTGDSRDDAFYIRRCVELARRAAGCTSPNPMVGCVIVKDGEVVGEGFHPQAGQPHAEVFALRNAGNLAENATAYVSLEPCNHYGRTPPCTEALIHAKVRRVVVGMVDPNPIVASKGVERLKETGIDVRVGVEEALCRQLNEAYIHRILTGRPFLTLRYSLAVSGGVLAHMGEGAKELGGYYSQLLQEYDGVVISSNSINQNSSLPASQEAGANQPAVFIVARRGNPPLNLTVLAKEDTRRAVIFIEEGTIVDPHTDRELNRLGIERVVVDKIKLNHIMEYCMRRGFCSLLLDLTDDHSQFGDIFEEANEEGQLQKVITEICPVWDNKSTSSSVVNIGTKALELRDLQSMVSKGSVLVVGYVI